MAMGGRFENAAIGIFALAMWWDRSDRVRQTRRSDVAFWLHLLAAPMIAHPIFHLLGVTDGGNIGSGAAVLVIGVSLLFGLIALAIDRRALLVSALAYVLFAMTQLFNTFGAVELNVALTAFVGSVQGGARLERQFFVCSSGCNNRFM